MTDRIHSNDSPQVRIDIRYTLGELAQLLDISCVGDAGTVITGLATLSSADSNQLSFLANSRYQKALETSTAAAVIVAPDMVDNCPVACLVSSNPYLSYALATQLFAPSLASGAGIHSSAVIGENANIASSATIAAHSVIGDNVSIGANTVVSAGCVVGHDCIVGDDCILHANVTLYHQVTLGNKVIIHSSAVLGADGFGFSPAANKLVDGWVKIAQLGGVTVGDRVEIGAGTTIDRGALDDTVIGNGVILDNQVQIAHNVRLGDNTAIAGCTAVAGSTTIGSNCTIAGKVGIIGHLTIVDGVHVTAMSLVTKSIGKAGSYSSGTMMQESRAWRRSAVRMSQLDELVRRVAELEKK